MPTFSVELEVPVDGSTDVNPTARKSVGHSAAALVRAFGRDPKTVQLERQVVAFFVDAAEILGIPKSVAAIYGICFANAHPLSFADIHGRLDISQGSVSQGLRFLKDMGALKVAGTHDRRDYFTPEMELRKLISRFIEERLEKQLTAGGNRLKAIDLLIARGDHSVKALRARLRYLQRWQNKSVALVPLVKSFLRLN